MSDMYVMFLQPKAVPIYIFLVCLYYGIVLVRDKKENGKDRPATTGEKAGGSILIIISILILAAGIWAITKY